MKRMSVLLMFSALTTGAFAQDTITGAGATFPAPLYAKWASAAKGATDLAVNYQAIGSGGGQTQIINRTVDFGASDAPMDPTKLEDNNLLQFPTVMGAVVVIVNIPGIATNQLRLTGSLVADMYLGKIKKWDHSEIAALNPNLKLPNLDVAPIYRGDGSGTTFVFTSYLSAVSTEWATSVKAGTSVRWIAGTGAKGNDGVAANVRQIKGGIGYVESAYATVNKLTATQLQNKSGTFVSPSMQSFEAAAASANWTEAKNYAVNLIDREGVNSWPIVSATFILLPKNGNARRTESVLKFFDWAYSSGDEIARSLDYIPLPETVKNAVRADWKSLSQN